MLKILSAIIFFTIFTASCTDNHNENTDGTSQDSELQVFELVNGVSFAVQDGEILIERDQKVVDEYFSAVEHIYIDAPLMAVYDSPKYRLYLGKPINLNIGGSEVNPATDTIMDTVSLLKVMPVYDTVKVLSEENSDYILYSAYGEENLYPIIETMKINIAKTDYQVVVTHDDIADTLGYSNLRERFIEEN
jgi:hypothetical protein